MARAAEISNTGTLIATNVAGRDMTNNTTTTYAPTEIHNVWQSVADAIQSAPPEKQAEATTKLKELKAEAAKGTKAEDTTLARLVKGLVGFGPVRGERCSQRLWNTDFGWRRRPGNQICA